MLRRKLGLTIYDSSKINFFITLTLDPSIMTLPVQQQYETSWNVVQNMLEFADMVITIPEFTQDCNLHYHIVASFTNDQIQVFNESLNKAVIKNKNITQLDEYIKYKLRNRRNDYGLNIIGENMDVEALSHPSQDFISYLYKDVDRTIKIGGYGVLKYTIRANKVEDLKLEPLVNYKKLKK